MATNNTITAQELNSETPLKQLFNKRDGARISGLNKARDCSKLTIPSVLPQASFTENTSLPDTYNSLGARCVNNLSSKLLLGLLPPNSAFFRLKETDKLLAQNNGQPDQKIEQQLSNLEYMVMDKIETSGMRPVVHQAFINLIITGNACLLYEDDVMSLYKYDSYVAERDFSGNLIDIILKEKISYEALPQEVQNKITVTEDEKKKDIDIYTRYYRLSEHQWLTYQEVKGEIVDGSDTTIKDTHLPVIVLRWSKISGENYGRGLVEMYLGDFRSLEGLTQMMLEYSAIAAKVIFGITPGSTIEIDELEESENGGVIVGNLERDVTRLSVDKQADMQIPMQMVEDITKRLAAAFLLQSATTRNSERTTALEVSYLAKELEDQLGGIYSVIAQEFQLPLVNLMLQSLKFNLDGLAEPVVTTGLSALGRTQDLAKLQQMNQLIAEVAPDYLTKYLNVQEYLTRIATALGIKDVKDLFVSQDQVAQEQQQQTDAGVPNVQQPQQPQQ